MVKRNQFVLYVAFEMASFQNVYDDLREKLIARGIPAEEIAFIHDANTDAQKKELFGKVRSGQIRVLLGSTQKMGAGSIALNALFQGSRLLRKIFDDLILQGVPLAEVIGFQQFQALLWSYPLRASVRNIGSH